MNEIIRLAAADGLVYAHTSAAPHRPTTLAELEPRTAGSFIRVSRAELVNLSHVHRISGSGDGSATLTLTDGTSVHVSRRRAADVRRAGAVTAHPRNSTVRRVAAKLRRAALSQWPHRTMWPNKRSGMTQEV
jgi:hypothetical protein